MSNEMRRAKLILRATQLNEAFYMNNLKPFYFLERLVGALAEYEKVNFEKVDLVLTICDLFGEHDETDTEEHKLEMDRLVVEVING